MFRLGTLTTRPIDDTNRPDPYETRAGERANTENQHDVGHSEGGHHSKEHRVVCAYSLHNYCNILHVETIDNFGTFAQHV
ncbi:MAG: hypothetical protein GY820_31780 [Gammaproteobacteria bacterium]|nr:hypothetical protein [Gammaproteobacteria bacterium]